MPSGPRAAGAAREPAADEFATALVITGVQAGQVYPVLLVPLARPKEGGKEGGSVYTQSDLEVQNWDSGVIRSDGCVARRQQAAKRGGWEGAIDHESGRSTDGRPWRAADGRPTRGGDWRDRGAAWRRW